ncbi:hypothetical protein ACLKAH_005152 [Escherichia coli]|nr:hypothetical protein [Escherichia coli]
MSVGVSKLLVCELKEVCRVGYLLDADFSVLELKEHCLSVDNNDYCLTVSYLGGSKATWVREYAMILSEKGCSEEEIIIVARDLTEYKEKKNEEEDRPVAQLIYKQSKNKSHKYNKIIIDEVFMGETRDGSCLEDRVLAFLLKWYCRVAHSCLTG